MKISEMIKVLQKEQESRGDVDVILYGCYGADSETFEVAPDDALDIKAKKSGKLYIWTAINTG